ncbi:hypothetical protein [Pseudomonas hunanensis]|uniref:hypothetical protein n=1 Tax=Pseudomonas hunanensis TaxID=1247546 RepID=UPI00240655FA|nr:hypothetical protein [Pseudomonas hunanensis]MDF9756761.1 hypothetical protein [Pseudomonas hunanensis]
MKIDPGLSPVARPSFYRSTDMPRLTLGVWLFIVCLMAGLAGSIWLIFEAIT